MSDPAGEEHDCKRREIHTAGRKQYRYHASYRAAQERAKFERLLEFSTRLPRFRELTADHLRTPARLDREWTCAIPSESSTRPGFGSGRIATRADRGRMA